MYVSMFVKCLIEIIFEGFRERATSACMPRSSDFRKGNNNLFWPSLHNEGSVCGMHDKIFRF